MPAGWVDWVGVCVCRLISVAPSSALGCYLVVLFWGYGFCGILFGSFRGQSAKAKTFGRLPRASHWSMTWCKKQVISRGRHHLGSGICGFRVLSRVFRGCDPLRARLAVALLVEISACVMRHALRGVNCIASDPSCEESLRRSNQLEQMSRLMNTSQPACKPVMAFDHSSRQYEEDTSLRDITITRV